MHVHSVSEGFPVDFGQTQDTCTYRCETPNLNLYIVLEVMNESCAHKGTTVVLLCGWMKVYLIPAESDIPADVLNVSSCCEDVLPHLENPLVDTCGLPNALVLLSLYM